MARFTSASKRRGRRRRALQHSKNGPADQRPQYVTGPTDCVLIVVCRDLPAYEAFLNDANVKSFTTHVVLERMKTGQALDL
jgi:Lrp/AsnC family transcriptional regulator, leucine-responsive regulatory protein